QGLVVVRELDAPRISGAAERVIEKQGREALTLFEVEDAQRVRVHPAAIELRRGDVKAADRVDGVGATSVRRDRDLTDRGRARRQAKVALVLEPVEVDQAYDRGEVGARGASARE